jgi:hypothetical protein
VIILVARRLGEEYEEPNLAAWLASQKPLHKQRGCEDGKDSCGDAVLEHPGDRLAGVDRQSLACPASSSYPSRSLLSLS